MPLWDWTELCHALGLPPRRGPDVAGVQFDTRKLAPGELFIALPGDPGPRFHASAVSARDGHDFMTAAVDARAAGAVVNRGIAAPLATLRVAGSTIDAFWQLARHRRARIRGPVVGITGSSGKTTMTAFVSAVLGLPIPAGSFNNYIGVPYRLVNTPRGARATVIEIGMNHPGEIAPLADLAKPDIAVVLNILPAHIENFLSIDGIRAEKFSISDGLEPGGILVHPISERPSTRSRSITFGFNDGDVAIRTIENDWAQIDIAGVIKRLKVPGGGEHRAMTVAATAAVALSAELDLAELDRLASVALPSGRGQITTIGSIDLIDDSYNANPISMAAALATLASMRTKGGRVRRLVAVLGEMKELGEHAARYHRELAGACADLDGIVCVGDGIEPLVDALDPEKVWGFHRDAASALEPLADRLKPDDVLLVKGSNRVFWTEGFMPALKRAVDEKFSRPS